MKKVIKKCLTLFLVLTLMLGMLQWPLSAEAADVASGSWLDYAGNSDLTYSAATSEYTIDSAEDLAWVAYEVNTGVTTFSGCTFTITKDINLSEHFWTPIGSSSAACFSGTFKGSSEYAISGLTIGTAASPDTLYSAGLFGYINGATIENVNLTALSIFESSAYAVGGVVGIASNGSTIDSCYVSGNFGSGETKCLGGICGEFYEMDKLGGSIKNCSTSSILDGYWFAGGIIGFARYITVMNCSSAGLISGEHVVSGSYSAGGTGGIVGGSETITVQNCFSSCDITGTSTFAGGLSAYTYGSTYTNNYSVGSVRGNTSDVGVGGFFGAQWSNTVTNCYWEKTAGISASGTSFGSGVVTSQTETFMKSADFTTLLNENANAITDASGWVIVSGKNADYPQLNGVGVFGPLSAPMALNSTVSGYPVVGMTLTADYDFCDLHNAAESGTTYQWYEASDSNGTDITAISGATQKTYALTSSDLGKYLCVEVTPSNGTFSGTTEKSTMTAVITSSIFTLGSGSASDPYIITNLAQLQSVANYPTAYFKLNNDITDVLTSPICDNTNKFIGGFDGNGCSITVDISVTASSYAGAFGYIGSGGYIANLTVKGAVANSQATNYVGGLAGYNVGTIENCKSEVDVTATGSTGYMAGGLVGYNSGKISNSSATGDVTGGTVTGTSFIGGLVGNNNSTSSTSGGTTTLSNKATLTNCNASGNVTTTSTTTTVAAGGLVGANYLSSTTSLSASNYNISDCYATGEVRSAGGYVGGFMGISMVTSVTNCFASGSVSGSGAVYAGAFAGFTRSGAIIDHCYATGSVGGNSTKKSTTYYGGFIGYFSSGTIQYSYSGSTVSTNNAYAGGMVGYYKAGTVIGCYWNADKNTLAAGSVPASTSDVNTYGTGLTTAKMVGAEASANMPSLDFTTPYFKTKTTDENYGYMPQLSVLSNSTNTGVAADSLESVSLSSACDVTSWTMPPDAAINGTNISKTVANSVASLTASVTVSAGATWQLFSDSGCTSSMENNTMSLNVGDNTAYLLVTAANGVTKKTYTLTVTRETLPIVLISSITVTGDDNATSVINGSTLQMSAAILPDNATDKSVTWSVTNGTGSATIDENGLLITKTVGTVTVISTAKDGSGKYGSAEITITAANTAPARKSGVTATGAASITVNNPYTLDLSTIFEDIDSDALTYKVSVNGGAEQTAAENYSYTPATTDEVILVFKANDSKADSTDTYTVTLTVNPIKTYSVSLSQTDAYTFTAQTAGYSSVSPLSVTVSNTGNQATGDLTVVLTGTNATGFTLSKVALGSIVSDGTDTFTVAPNTGLSAGIYTATVTVSGDKVTSQIFHVSFTVNPVSTYGISLSQTGLHTFTARTVGYIDSDLTPLSVTVSNTGNQATGDLTVVLTGTNATSFTLSKLALGSIVSDGTDTFTIVPNTGLSAGIYTATVTVSGDKVTSQTFQVSFTVNPVSTYGISLSQTDAYTFAAQTTGYSSVSPLSVTVSNNGNQATGDLTVALTGTNATSFTLSKVALGSIVSDGTDTFTIVPNTGLSAGIYTATVTVSGDKVTSQTFHVSFTVNPVSTYGISLSQTDAYTFAAQTAGYSSLSPLSVTVSNMGNQATGDLTVALTGTNATSFILSKVALGSIVSDGTDTFTVAPNTGLSAGIYTATVTVSGDKVTSQTFHVSFTVNPVSTYGISLSQTDAYTFAAQTAGYSSLSPLSVTVSNMGNQATGDLTVALTGTNATSFTLSKVALGSIVSDGTDTFTVVQNTGLSAGIYTATVTVSGDKVTSQTFHVSFTVNPVSTYGISLSQTDAYTFAAQTAGYSSLSPLSVTVSNMGNQATGDLTVALTGTNATSFTLSKVALGSIVSDGTDTFTVVPNTGLSAGTYTATVTVSGDNVIQQTFTVSFTVEEDTQSGAKAIIGFEIGSVDGTINEFNHTIAVTLPYGTDMTSLTPTITVSDKASVSPNSGTTQDFTSPVTYTVTAENGSTQSYIVTATVAAETSCGIILSQTTAYIFPGQKNGYSSITPLPVTVTSAGNQATGDLTIALNGANATSFTLSKMTLGSIASGGTDSFAIAPLTGLSAGTYKATVTVSGDNVTSQYFDISFTVSSADSGGSTGGGSSAGGSPPSTKIFVTTENNITSATQIFNASTGSNGMAAANVTKSQISEMFMAAQAKAAPNAQTAVNLQIKTVRGTSGVSVTLPQEAVTSLTSSETSLIVSATVATVALDSAVLAEISKQTSGDVTIKATVADTSALSEEAKAAIGARPVYDLKITSGSTTVSSFGGGTATVSVPYTPAPGEDINAIVVYYINASGELVTVPNGVYDAKTKTVTFTTTHFSTYAVGYNEVRFSDVADSAWYANYVTYLAARGTVGGNKGAFNPDDSITRAEFVAILARMSGDDKSAYTAFSFTDVAANSWYFAAVQWANMAGIASGYDGKFNPSATITREQMAAMLYRYAEYKGTVSNAEGMSVREFTDYGSISSWAQAPIQWAKNNSILSGNNDGSFAPQLSATRAQAAKMIAVLMQGLE